MHAFPAGPACFPLRTLSCGLAIAFAAFWTNPAAAEMPRERMAKADRLMLRAAAQNHVAEIDAGRLVAARGRSPDVRAYALRNTAAHSRQLDLLQQLAFSRGVTLPLAADLQQQAALAVWRTLAVERLEDVYRRQGGVSHSGVAARRYRAALLSGDVQVRTYAYQAMEAMKPHLAVAE